MSWRDRLLNRDPGRFAGPANSAEDPIDTIGTIGNKTFLTTGRPGDARKQRGSDQDLSRGPLPGSRAAGAKSADRPDTFPHIAIEADAISAESASSADDAHLPVGDRDASSAESADRAYVGDHRLDDHEERPAIIEHDGRIPHAWAEGFARLDPNRPPGGVSTRRWLQFVDDVGRFLDHGWAPQAVALGWGPYDLFGADRERPFARIDRAGLIWLLNGDRLLALTESTATIEKPTGMRHTYRRKPAEPCRVLPWEMAQ